MELLAIGVVVAFVVGVLVGGRLKLSNWQGKGGWTTVINGQSWHFDRHELPAIIRLLTRDELRIVNAADAAGVLATPQQLDAAQAALQRAAERWIAANPERARQKLGLD